MLILKSNYLSINKDKKNQRNKYGCREEIDGRAQAVAVIMLLKWVTVGWGEPIMVVSCKCGGRAINSSSAGVGVQIVAW